jgi:hypothetical protein
LAAVCAVVSLSPISFAQETTKQQVEGAPAGQADAPAAPANDAPARRPLMSLLDAAGIGQAMDDLGISLYGHAQASYQYNFRDPVGRMNYGRVFDTDDQEIILNQLDLTLQRVADPTKSADFGFTIETIYGADSRYIHTNGLNFYGPGDVARGPQLDPENQFDLTQAYIDIVPVESVMIRAGKFATHVGYETINPTTTPFFSHAYMFGYAIPFFHTGVEVYWYPTDKLTLMAGITRGWEQSTKDDNDVVSPVGQVKYVFTDKLTGYFNFVVGPEKRDNNDDTRVILDAILSYAVTDRFSVAVNADYGWEESTAADGDTASWAAASVYGSYKINDPLTFNVRGEWFDDTDGARGFNTTLYEATAGFTITPFPGDGVMSNLKLRPEIRYDYADDAVFDDQNYQVSAAIDAIFTF